MLTLIKILTTAPVEWNLLRPFFNNAHLHKKLFTHARACTSATTLAGETSPSTTLITVHFNDSELDGNCAHLTSEIIPVYTYLIRLLTNVPGLILTNARQGNRHRNL